MSLAMLLIVKSDKRLVCDRRKTTPTNRKRLKGAGVIYSYYVIIGVQYSDLLDRTHDTTATQNKATKLLG
jgi:hypothetical protein